MMLVNNRTGMKIGVQNLPGLSRPCLVVQDNAQIVKYASFNNDFMADEFMQILADFVGAERREDE